MTASVWSGWEQGGWYPSVWFAEADDSHLTDDERRPEGVAPDTSDRYDEEHFEKQREYGKRVYRQDPATEAEPITPTVPPTIPPTIPPTDQISNRTFDQPAPDLAAFKADLDAAAQTVAVAKQITADAIAKAQQRMRDDEEALILILSQIL